MSKKHIAEIKARHQDVQVLLTEIESLEKKLDDTFQWGRELEHRLGTAYHDVQVNVSETVKILSENERLKAALGDK